MIFFVSILAVSFIFLIIIISLMFYYDTHDLSDFILFILASVIIMMLASYGLMKITEVFT